MDQRHREIVQMGDSLFGQRTVLLNTWQTIAENFYPQRADFTSQMGLGDQFAENLFSSYPLLANRELSGAISSMLRPDKASWFELHASDDDVDDEDEVRAYLERVTEVQRRAMYDPAANFVRATKQADADFVPFGQAVIQVELHPLTPALLHTTHHLRDCAWAENVAGQIDVMHRKWKPSARDLKDRFANTKLGVHRDVLEKCKDKPFDTVDCRHAVVPTRLYKYEDKSGRKYPFTSLFIDIEHEHVLEEVPLKWFPYVVPRWQTISGSQYARSPATELVLADANTTQAVMRSLLEAGEKYVDPPMIAVQEALRSDVALYAGGLTWVDVAYDERLGEALRPLSQDRGGMPIGFEIAADLRETIRSGFFLDKVQLPEAGADMTAYEVSRRLEEHIRAVTPLFEPIEQEYSLPLCELDFQILMDQGAFGSPDLIPDALKAANIEYRFDSPLKSAAERKKAAQFGEGMQVVQAAAAIDPSAVEHVDVDEATRESLRGLGWSSDWIRDEDDVAARRQQMAEQQQAQMAAEAIAGAAG